MSAPGGPTSLRDTLTGLVKAPVTAALTGAAAVVFLAGLAGRDVSRLHLDVRAFHGEPWRIAATMLPHSDVLHLGFNLLWLVRLGPPVERGLGSFRTLLLALLLGSGAALAEYALAGTAIGLSGVGFGLVAFLAVADRDPRFHGVVGPRETRLFAAWFVFCIVTTATGLWRVANFAHAVGAALGAIAGLAASRRPVPARLALVGAALLFGASLVGATALRPRVHLVGSASADSAYLAFLALEEGRPAESERLLREAIRVEPACGACWHNLGVTLYHLERREDSLDAFRRALVLQPGDPRTRQSLLDGLTYEGSKALEEERLQHARSLLEEATQLGGSFAAWTNLGVVLARLGDEDGAREAHARAAHVREAQVPEAQVPEAEMR